MTKDHNKWGRWCNGILFGIILVVMGTVSGVTVLLVKHNGTLPQESDTVKINNLELSQNGLALRMTNGHNKTTLNGVLWTSDEHTEPIRINKGPDSVSFTWPRDRSLNITSQIFADDAGGEITCYEMNWVTMSCQSQVIQDCYDMSSAHWYGGYEDFRQYWPLERTVRKTSPYIATDTYVDEIGQVLERYFFSTNGIGIFIDHDVPLYISINDTNSKKLCLIAKYDRFYPYQNDNGRQPHLKYNICQGQNVKNIHLFMANKFWEKPRGIPDTRMIRSPIWSTWAQYKKDIDANKVMDFALNIIKYNFSHSQLEIDDDWTPHYGDLEFNTKKFPNPVELITNLTILGFRTTLWVHPFCNLDAACFLEGGEKGYFIKQYDSLLPAAVSWWDGKMAASLDVTNANATQWFLGKLKALQNKYNISSFKFDAGGTNYVASSFSFAERGQNINIYPENWARLAFAADNISRHQEVRVGFHTQDLPIFVRMLDLFSVWDRNNGLEKLIPCALTFGLIGYPFILPDMIGGNAYDNRTASKELYIRWLQASVFMPSLQFSLTPWSFDEETVNITRENIQLHEQHADLLVELAHNATRTGHPILRPLWWIAPNDPVAQVIDDQFLVGDNLLVAPVIKEGARSRDIYIPTGTWTDVLRGRSVSAGWQRNYSVALSELPYFTRIL